MNTYTCKFCKGEGDHSLFAEYRSDEKEGVCNYCMDELYQPDQDRIEKDGKPQ